MKKKVVIITSDSIRHRYFTSLIGGHGGVDLLCAYVESNSPGAAINKEFTENDDLESIHYIGRVNTELDFFSDLVEKSVGLPKKYIKPKQINDPEIVEEIISLKPDIIVTYGCSIIKPPLIEAMRNKIINVHLGLSPYYLGAGTNMHAMANGEFQYCGYSLIFIDEGIDTGEIIHQEVGQLDYFDNPHTLGNRIIKDMAHKMLGLILNFEKIKRYDPISFDNPKVYKKKDATIDVLKRLYENFAFERNQSFVKNYKSLIPPLVQQDFLREGE